MAARGGEVSSRVRHVVDAVAPVMTAMLRAARVPSPGNRFPRVGLSYVRPVGGRAVPPCFRRRRLGEAGEAKREQREQKRNASEEAAVKRYQWSARLVVKVKIPRTSKLLAKKNLFSPPSGRLLLDNGRNYCPRTRRKSVSLPIALIFR